MINFDVVDTNIPQNYNSETAIQTIKDLFASNVDILIEQSKIVVTNDETEKRSIEIEAAAKKYIKEIQQKEAERFGEQYDFTKTVKGHVKFFIDKLKAVVDNQKKARKDYSWGKEVERRKKEKLLQEAQAKAMKEMEKQAKKAKIDISDIKPAPAPIVPKQQITRTESGASSSFQDHWKYRVVDIEKVDRSLMMVDDQKIKALVRAGKRGTELSGIEIYNDPILKTRI